MKKTIFKYLLTFLSTFIIIILTSGVFVAFAENSIDIPNEYYIDYAAKINQVTDETFANGRLAFNEFMLYDIDNNGIKEMLIKTGGSEADATITIYTYDNGVKELATISGWHSLICETETGNGLYRYTFHMSVGSKYLITLNNGIIEEKTIFSEKDYSGQEYPVLNEITMYSFTSEYFDSIDFNGFTEKHGDLSFSGVWSDNGRWMLTKNGDLYLSGTANDAGSISVWRYTKDDLYLLNSWEKYNSSITVPDECEYPVKRIFLLEEYEFNPYINIFYRDNNLLSDVYIYDKNADFSYEMSPYTNGNIKDVVVHGYSQSTAQKFAEENNLEFKLIETDNSNNYKQPEKEESSVHMNTDIKNSSDLQTGKTYSIFLYILLSVFIFSIIAVIALIIILILRKKRSE